MGRGRARSFFTRFSETHHPSTAEPLTGFANTRCGEHNAQIVIGKENHFLADGFLMPVRKGQKPPDLRYFEQTRP
jgi:hypothetical protein